MEVSKIFDIIVIENILLFNPVSTISDRRQRVVLLLIRRLLLGNEGKATRKSEPAYAVNK